jgi:hypothetical protein
MITTTNPDTSLRSMDPSLDLETRRLLISTTLAAQVRRRLGRRVPADSGPGELLELAHELGEAAGSVARAYRLCFAPPYPGVTAGAEDVGESSRLLLACRVSDRDGSTIGVAFTALIAGRPPQVSVAPPQALLPEGWRLPADLH